MQETLLQSFKREKMIALNINKSLSKTINNVCLEIVLNYKSNLLQSLKCVSSSMIKISTLKICENLQHLINKKSSFMNTLYLHASFIS